MGGLEVTDCWGWQTTKNNCCPTLRDVVTLFPDYNGHNWCAYFQRYCGKYDICNRRLVGIIGNRKLLPCEKYYWEISLNGRTAEYPVYFGIGYKNVIDFCELNSMHDDSWSSIIYRS